MDLILNDWKYILRPTTSQKYLLETFYNNNKGTGKVKNMQKLSKNKFTLPFNLLALNKTTFQIQFMTKRL